MVLVIVCTASSDFNFMAKTCEQAPTEAGFISTSEDRTQNTPWISHQSGHHEQQLVPSS